MSIILYVIDAFTTQRFTGNPTAVCVLEKELEHKTRHQIAIELNFPVTAFIEAKNTEGVFPISYFTVTGEIPACGHATLASARVIVELTQSTAAQFKTVEGRLIEASLKSDIVYLTYPKFEAGPFEISQKTLHSLGINDHLSLGFCKELETLFIELADPVLLRGLKPYFPMLLESSQDFKEVVVHSFSDDSAYDFLLRSFCPWMGIDEDPVTGSVHSFLVPFWKEKLSKSSLVAYQASGRGGEVFLNDLAQQVELGGKTVIVCKGELYL